MADLFLFRYLPLVVRNGWLVQTSEEEVLEVLCPITVLSFLSNAEKSSREHQHSPSPGDEEW